MSATQPLIVDVAWVQVPDIDVHPVADAIFRTLTGDPDGRAARLGMPVHFRRLGAASSIDPSSWPSGERRAVVVLADSSLLGSLSVRNSPARCDVELLLNHAHEHDWLVLPVALDPGALANTLLSGATNMIRPPTDGGAAQFVAGSVALQLHRLLAPDRTVSAFISYATRDGSEIAEGLKAHLDLDTQLSSFLDRSDIYAGENFSSVLDTHVIAGPVVAIVTDAYAASVWCGREIVLAKQAGQPVVVIDAVADGHDRAFPYLGNGPVVRWRPDDPAGTYRRVVRLAVEDSLRRTYLPLRIAHLCELAGIAHPEVVLTRAPELMTLVGAAGAIGADGRSDVVYPDPPIPSTELGLLTAAFPALRLRTPTEDVAMIAHDSLIALSVSAAAPADLHERGLSGLHLRFLFTELVRHVLVAGGGIAYGGRLDDPADQEPNFTRVMLDMVSGYRPDLRPADSQLVNYVAATVWDADDPATKATYQQRLAQYHGRFQVEQCPRAPRRPAPTTERLALDALAFTSMREQMAEQCLARVVIGGGLDTYAGRYPGVVEEALLTTAAGHPLFVIGGFGGAGAALAAHVRGEGVPELTQQWHLEHVPSAAALAPMLAGSPYSLQLDADLATTLPPGQWSALRNGLGDTDNRRLATTTDIDEIVALVLRGLHTIAC